MNLKIALLQLKNSQITKNQDILFG